MKLITKTTLLYLILFFVAIAASGLLISKQSQNLFDRQVEHFFRRKAYGTLYHLNRDATPVQLNNVYRNVVDLGTEIQDTSQISYGQSMIGESDRDEPQLYRSKNIIRKVKDHYYSITLYKNVDEYRNLQKEIFNILVWVFLGLVLVLMIFNFFISRWLWRPFYYTLRQMRNFSIGGDQDLVLLSTSTGEFKELNILYDQMVKRIEADYRNLKEFTENTAHEIQTPLAMIKAKVENILQHQDLDKEVLTTLSSINKSASNLSRLSRTLNLLTKIENHEFVSKQPIQMAEFMQQMIFNFKELAGLKGIQIQCNLDQKQVVIMDPFLLDILVSNLLKNAIRYNHPQGKIDINSSDTTITFVNTGAHLGFDKSKLFQRFYGRKTSDNSLGLGLAIVKKICDMNGITIRYDYEVNKHRFTLNMMAVVKGVE